MLAPLKHFFSRTFQHRKKYGQQQVSTCLWCLHPTLEHHFKSWIRWVQSSSLLMRLRTSGSQLQTDVRIWGVNQQLGDLCLSLSLSFPVTLSFKNSKYFFIEEIIFKNASFSNYENYINLAVFSFFLLVFFLYFSFFIISPSVIFSVGIF